MKREIGLFALGAVLGTGGSWIVENTNFMTAITKSKPNDSLVGQDEFSWRPAQEIRATHYFVVSGNQICSGADAYSSKPIIKDPRVVDQLLVGERLDKQTGDCEVGLTLSYGKGIFLGQPAQILRVTNLSNRNGVQYIDQGPDATVNYLYFGLVDGAGHFTSGNIINLNTFDDLNISGEATREKDGLVRVLLGQENKK